MSWKTQAASSQPPELPSCERSAAHEGVQERPQPSSLGMELMRPQGGGKEAAVTKYRTRLIPGHPLADKDGRVYIHREILFTKLGEGKHACHWCARPLAWLVSGGAKIVVDHLDDNCWNNDPSNLVPACRHCNQVRSAHPNFLTHCKKGHEYTPDNVYRRSNGGRMCRICMNIRDARRVRIRRCV